MNLNDQHHEEILNKMEKIFERLDMIDSKVNPMYEMFSSVSGFNRISVWILKILAGIGSAILALYVVLEFFKKIAK